ncbi:shikimate kinase [Sulfurisphaera ohwakuensis]|uniref:Shikimate kinase n=1 Tax=Sulfurisphaera ohwakuensis TaxID=69656 RepID=A0A650CJD1_SULOH|nr:shikimate kinase [Sulfurisphaera ohwakuensis]MBB5254026.1 shikimate kinase [Sulfurisphaera ohwakuensis]QGR17906.1 shikimate kinase [Sulfurisphaera ohwakuensis]
MQTYAGISVVNALPSWYGSSMAVNLTVSVSIKEAEKCKKNDILIDTILNFFHEKYGIPCLDINVESQIPEKSGLKSSSAVSTALIGEISKKFGIEIDVPKYSAILSLKAGVSYTGALDDATSSYYGGVSFTYNKEFKIIDIKDPPELSAIILPRGGRNIKIDLQYLKKYRLIFEEIFRVSRQNIVLGMKLNGILVANILGYDINEIEVALKKGALAAGITGNGPSIFAVTKIGEEGPIVDALSKFGNVIVTRSVGYVSRD